MYKYTGGYPTPWNQHIVTCLAAHNIYILTCLLFKNSAYLGLDSSLVIKMIRFLFRKIWHINVGTLKMLSVNLMVWIQWTTSGALFAEQAFSIPSSMLQLPMPSENPVLNAGRLSKEVCDMAQKVPIEGKVGGNHTLLPWAWDSFFPLVEQYLWIQSNIHSNSKRTRVG